MHDSGVQCVKLVVSGLVQCVECRWLHNRRFKGSGRRVRSISFTASHINWYSIL